MPAKVRGKLLATLFASVGVTRTGFLAAATVTALVAQETLGSATWAGLPGAVAVIGMALGTAPLSWFMARHGRRRGMVIGQVIAGVGALVAAVATDVAVFPLLVLALFVMGFGNAADRLARYAAADVSAPERRSSAIALIVWAGTIGSVAGPALLEPARGLAETLGFVGLAGPYVLAGAMYAVAGLVVFVFLRPDPLDLAPDERIERGEQPLPVRELLRPPLVRVALAALLTSQFVMVLIMTMTPIHIRAAGESLGAVGLVISAHTLGMFALSPVTGYLSDRFGRFPVIVAGLTMLAASGVIASTTGGADRLLLVVALFLLGLGWNFGYVAGSALVVEAVEPHRRLQIQGVADSMVWIFGAAAGLASGFLLAGGGYRLVSLVGSALVAVPVVVIVRERRRSGSVSVPLRRT